MRIELQTFERWPGAAGGFGLLLAAQSWHWVDPEVRWGKAARTLSAGGALALLGHSVRWQGEPIRDELEDVYRRVAPELLAQDPGFPGLHRGDGETLVGEIERSGLFDEVTVRDRPWSERLTTASFLDVLATQSDHRLLTDAAREALFDALGELISARGGEVVVPHVTTLTLARLRSG